MDHDLSTALGGVGHTARVQLLPGGVRGFDSAVTQYCSQHHVHLHGGERGTHTASGTATVRKPSKAGRLGSDVTLWVESVRIGEQLRVRVQRRNADDDGVPVWD